MTTADDRLAHVRACVFDAYGTLFDVHSAVATFKAEVGERHAELSAIWRIKQLEYTWLRSLMRSHTDFWQVTDQALDYALQTIAIDNPQLKQKLMQAYLQLSAFTEVESVLGTLKKAGYKIGILTNGSPNMIESAVSSAGLDSYIDYQLSVESVGIFKPDARVYQLAVDTLDIPAEEICFQSSNAWDAAGAAHFGMKVVWVNRYTQPAENLPGMPTAELNDLSGLPALLGLR